MGTKHGHWLITTRIELKENYSIYAAQSKKDNHELDQLMQYTNIVIFVKTWIRYLALSAEGNKKCIRMEAKWKKKKEQTKKEIDIENDLRITHHELWCQEKKKTVKPQKILASCNLNSEFQSKSLVVKLFDAYNCIVSPFRDLYCRPKKKTDFGGFFNHSTIFSLRYFHAFSVTESFISRVS